MKDTLAGIVSMLELGDPGQRVAAAQVLAWLKPRTPAIVKALGAIAEEGDAFLRSYAVDALAQIGNAAALAHLIPLLHVEGSLRNKVARSFARLGDSAEKVLVKEFEKADRDTQAVILEILAETRGPDAMRLIFQTLKDPDSADLAAPTARHLLASVRGLDPEAEERDKLRKALLAKLRRMPKKAPVEFKVQLLELLAEVGDRSCRTVFVNNSGPSQPPEVRAAALHGLRGYDLTPAQEIKLIAYLQEDDFLNVVGPSLEVLADLEPRGAPMASALGKLLESERPEVRLWAMRGLGNFQTATSAKQLLPFLDSPDPRVRALASAGLGRNPEAREGLVKMLLAARDLEESSRPFDALLELADQLTPDQLKKLVSRFLKLLEAEDPVRDLYQRILSAAKHEHVGPLLLDEAKKLRSHRRYHDALRVLQTLSSSGDSEMAGDVRYELAITTLLMRGRQPEIAEGDPVIGHFCHLIREGYTLLPRIKRERTLATEDVLYLGQRFVERLNDERRFGSELLAWLIKKQPEAKESVQAMQKLKVEGLA